MIRSFSYEKFIYTCESWLNYIYTNSSADICQGILSMALASGFGYDQRVNYKIPSGKILYT